MKLQINVMALSGRKFLKKFSKPGIFTCLSPERRRASRPEKVSLRGWSRKTAVSSNAVSLRDD
jgi:hypothetical protein